MTTRTENTLVSLAIYGALFLLCLSGCGQEPVEGFTPEPTLTCDPSADRVGTYLVDFDTIDGTCGEQTSAVVVLRADAPAGTGCTTDQETTSGDGCTLTRGGTCTDIPAAGLSTQVTMVTTQQDSSGDLLTGVFSMTISDATGPLCMGTYRVSAVRQ